MYIYYAKLKQVYYFYNIIVTQNTTIINYKKEFGFLFYLSISCRFLFSGG